MAPRHIGIIMDGNRRWAKQKALPALKGHYAGAENLRTIAFAAQDEGVKYVSAFAFSTENWQRPKTEVMYVMRLIVVFLDKYLQDFFDRKVRLVFAGSRDGLPKKVLAALDDAAEKTKRFKGTTLALCINYGGQQEIVDAARQLLKERFNPDKLSADEFARHLYAPDLPPLDLIIRTSGEFRTSGFMLYRSAYAEYAFVEKHWPDFTPQDLKDIIKYYGFRQRRFGK